MLVITFGKAEVGEFNVQIIIEKNVLRLKSNKKQRKEETKKGLDKRRVTWVEKQLKLHSWKGDVLVFGW